MMTRTPADVVRFIAIELGLATDPILAQAWPIFVNTEPDLPDNCITFYDSPGNMQGRTHNDGETQEAYGLQVRVRSQDYATAQLKIQSIAGIFDVVANETIVLMEEQGSGFEIFTVYGITRKTSVLFIGKEPQSGRKLFTCNYVVTIRQH